MHLFFFMQMRNPGVFTRVVIGLGQAIFLTAFNISYAISPKFSHRFVGYLEEEAVHTYSMCLKAIDDGKLPYWQHMKAPSEAIEYYGLDPNKAMVRDLILSIRADEAVHRSINHHFSDIPQYYEISNDKIQISNNSFRIDDIREETKMIDDSQRDTSDTSEDEHEAKTPAHGKPQKE